MDEKAYNEFRKKLMKEEAERALYQEYNISGPAFSGLLLGDLEAAAKVAEAMERAVNKFALDGFTISGNEIDEPLTIEKLQQKIEEFRAKAPPPAVALTTKLFPKGKTLKIPLADLARWIPELKDCKAVIFVINPETLSEIPAVVPEVAASLYSIPVINLDQEDK